MDIRAQYKGIIEGMASENRQVQWETMVKWCRLWIEVEKRELQPLLALIFQLKELGFWQKYYPSQSHCALGLSLGKNYEERYNLPMVYINYNTADHHFYIQYQKGQGGETTKVECGSNLSKTDFEAIALWLNDEKK